MKSGKRVKAVPKRSSFSVTFLDVGQCDSAIANCDGNYLLIDGGDAKSSLLLYAYLKGSGIDHLDYLVVTHPDPDHTGGASGVLQVSSVCRALSPVAEATQKSLISMVRYLGDMGVTLGVPAVGDSWKWDSTSVQVVGIRAADDSSNEQSIMLHIDYGSTSFLFTDEASADGESAFVNAGYGAECDVLKVAHHGSANSSSYVLLREIMPKNAGISVGGNNNYGHLSDAALSRLRDSGSAVYRIDLQRDITATSDGKTVTISIQKSPNSNTLTTPGAATASSKLTKVGYIGDKNSKKLHLPTYRTLPEEIKRKYFDNREEAIGAGYDSCGNCKP